MQPLSFFQRLQQRLGAARVAKLRAAVLLAHCLVVVLVAFPAPVRKLDAASWRKPTLRAELKNWTSRAQSLGLETNQAEVRQVATTWTNQWRRLRRGLAPLQAYLERLGIPQNWYMFTGPDRVPQAFSLSFIDRGGDTHEVLSLGHPVLRPDLVSQQFLDEHRVRRALMQAAWSRRERTFVDICRYFRGSLQARAPEVDRVICQLTARAVVHPSHPDRSRPTQVSRRLVLDSRGRASE
jgi:hypothetical protein